MKVLDILVVIAFYAASLVTPVLLGMSLSEEGMSDKTALLASTWAVVTIVFWSQMGRLCWRRDSA